MEDDACEEEEEEAGEEDEEAGEEDQDVKVPKKRRRVSDGARKKPAASKAKAKAKGKAKAKAKAKASSEVIKRKPRAKKDKENAEEGDGDGGDGKTTFAKRAKPSSWPEKWTTIRDTYMQHIKTKVQLQVWAEELLCLKS